MNPEQRDILIEQLYGMAHHKIGELGSPLCIALNDAASELEVLGPIAEAAKDVWAVAKSKGQLFSSDEQESDKLVGFFVPAWVMNNLGKSLLP